jgi:hypothetical protein
VVALRTKDKILCLKRNAYLPIIKSSHTELSDSSEPVFEGNCLILLSDGIICCGLFFAELKTIVVTN